MRKFIYFPIKITITASFILLFFTVVSIIIGFNYIKTSKSALLTAEQLMESKSQQIFLEIDKLYRPMSYLVQQAASLPAVGRKPTLQTHPAEDYMMNAMNIYRQIQIQYIGFQDGDFYAIYSLNENYYGTMRDNTHAPENARFAILRQFTLQNQDYPVRLWRYLNDKGQTIGSFKERDVSYDPRTRGWYQAANENNGIKKTAPYLFDNSQQFGVTVSASLDGATPGVYGVDILLSEIAEYLDKMKDSENEIILIFNQDLQITAVPNSMDLVIGEKLPFLGDSDEPLLARIAGKLEEVGISENMTLNMDMKRKDFLVKIMEIPDQFENKEYILIGIPRDDILGPIAQDALLNLAISVILFLSAVPVIIMVSTKISRPITKLAIEAAAIQNYNFTNDIKIKSRIREIHELSHEMNIMKRGLRHFNKYVPSRLVKHLMENNIDLAIGGIRRNISVMFTDIEQFTSISEKMEPEELMKQLSSYFEKATTIIRNHNGLVDKYIGDAIMAFWNAPYDDSTHMIHACRAALDINNELNKCKEIKKDNSTAIFNTRIGIDTGNVIVGNVGSSERMNYTVIGDTVNNSSRLEGLNKLYKTQILISKRIVDHLDDEFIFCPVARVIVMGKSVPQDIYELLDYRKDAEPSVIDYVSHFTKGFKLFFEQRWDEAEGEFTKADPDGSYPISLRFITRCRKYINNPPEPDWTGVEIIRRK